MAKTIDEIHQLLTYYTSDLHGDRIKNQKEVAEFYHDIFPVPWIKKPMIVSRTGAASELIDEPVEQISAANLIASRPQLKDTAIAKDSAVKVSELVNQDWIKRLMRQNPNPKKECIKNIFLRGESWIHPIHNPAWVKEPFDRTRLPVFFLTPDPMIIYASLNEDENGIPENVIVFYERMPWQVKFNYPDWKNLEGAGEKGKKSTTSWMEYWDKDIRYFEADGQQVLGISPNPYGFVPFIHKVSGFGKISPEGKPEELIVSRIWKYRDLLKRDAAITSDLDSSFHLFANPNLDAQGDDAHPVPDDFDKTYSLVAGNMNKIPPGVTVTRGVEMLPKQESLQWAYAIQATLGRKTPSALTGAPQGTTGRATDIPYGIAMRKYEGIVAGQADAWATAFGMALQMCDEMPNLMPDGISHKDIGKSYVVEVELRADDPLATSQKSTEGDAKQMNRIITHRTNLVKYQGFTQEEAEDEIDDLYVDEVIMNDPIIRRLVAIQIAREMGMEQEYAGLEEQMGAMEKGLSTAPQIGSEGGEQRIRNMQTEQGREMTDLATRQPQRERAML